MGITEGGDEAPEWQYDAYNYSVAENKHLHKKNSKATSSQPCHIVQRTFIVDLQIHNRRCYTMVRRRGIP